MIEFRLTTSLRACYRDGQRRRGGAQGMGCGLRRRACASDLTGIGEKEIPLREEAITFQHEMVQFTQARGLRARHPVENLQPSPLLYPVDPPM